MTRTYISEASNSNDYCIDCQRSIVTRFGEPVPVRCESCRNDFAKVGGHAVVFPACTAGSSKIIDFVLGDAGVPEPDYDTEPVHVHDWVLFHDDTKGGLSKICMWCKAPGALSTPGEIWIDRILREFKPQSRPHWPIEDGG